MKDCEIGRRNAKQVEEMRSAIIARLTNSNEKGRGFKISTRHAARAVPPSWHDMEAFELFFLLGRC